MIQGQSPHRHWDNLDSDFRQSPECSLSIGLYPPFVSILYWKKNLSSGHSFLQINIVIYHYMICRYAF